MDESSEPEGSIVTRRQVLSLASAAALGVGLTAIGSPQAGAASPRAAVLECVADLGVF